MTRSEKKKFILLCETCEQEFDRREYDVGRKYCSIKCALYGAIDVSQSGCWLWPKRLDKNGYGIIRFRYREYLAHRVGYAAWYGLDATIDEGVYNICGNRNCVRGDHWETK